MTIDPNAPITGKARRPAARAPTPGRLPFGIIASGLAIAGALAVARGAREPYGGEPYAVATIAPAGTPEPTATAPAPTPSAPAEEAQPATSGSLAEMESLSGVKVTRRGGEGSTARIIRVEPVSGVRLAPAPDPRVSEKGPYGPLPKIGAEGARPMDVYARPFVTPASGGRGAPRIALIVGGLGLDGPSSQDAIDQLPEGVTLAFAPYGAKVSRLAAQARARGHETLLQAPMEPFDYPRNNPGPHTLATGAAGGGVDDLRWLMSRFAGYAGVMNYLGDRFTADETAMQGALGEIARRGLFYIDDGASPQSRAGAVAQRLGAPFGKVDVLVDERGTPQAMDAALARIETLAQDKGAAIGFANATPGVVARLSRFARDLERRGAVLAPVSAILAPQAGQADGGRAAGGQKR